MNRRREIIARMKDTIDYLETAPHGDGIKVYVEAVGNMVRDLRDTFRPEECYYFVWQNERTGYLEHLIPDREED